MICRLSPQSNYSSSAVVFYISDENNKSYDFTSTFLRIKFKNTKNTTKRILASYIHILNDKEARLNYPYLDSTFDRASVSCCAGSKKTRPCSDQIIAVGCKLIILLH